ncbi:MAG: amidohydrolase, partial [Planctomycetota bacterium]
MRKRIAGCMLLALIAACSDDASPGATNFADLIFVGGDILTMTDAEPRAEALAVKDGRILAVGDRALVEEHKGGATRVVDLGDRALCPAFIDCHSHFSNALQVVNWVNVSGPPVGEIEDIPGIVAALKKHVEERKPGKGEWIIGYGLDSGLLAEGRDPTVDDLDPHFPDNPVMLIHVSNHGAVLNSNGLAKFKIDASTKTPPGGIIARKPGGNEPAGLLMETAFLPLFMEMPKPSEEELLARLGAVQTEYARNGYATAQEGATVLADLDLLRKAAAQGKLFIDVVSYVMIT